MSIQNDEKLAIKTYCTVARQIEQTKQGFQQGLKQHKLEADAHRTTLFELMKASNITCLPYGKGYARIKLNNSMRAVTREVVEDALGLLTKELVDEEKQKNPASAGDALIQVILHLIQSRRTKTKEYVEFSKFKPKDFNRANQPINERVEKACADWQAAKQKVDSVKQTQTHATRDLVEQQKSCEILVKQFMDRAELSSQRININERNGRTQTYFIKNKVSTTKPRITKDLIQKTVIQALQGIQSVEEVLRNKKGIALSIFEMLDNRPTTSKKCVRLVKGMLNEKK